MNISEHGKLGRLFFDNIVIVIDKGQLVFTSKAGSPEDSEKSPNFGKSSPNSVQNKKCQKIFIKAEFVST